MTGHPGGDKSLLERLNALKPSTVSLVSTAKTVSASITGTAQPLPRERGLSERLKSLRNKADSGNASGSVTETRAENGLKDDSSPEPPDAQPQSGNESREAAAEQSACLSAQSVTEDVDPLVFTDDQTLEELLADLGSDQQWLDELAAEEEEHQRVTSLLKEIEKAPREDYDSSNAAMANRQDDSTSDDDSDGHIMAHETHKVLVQTRDEVKYEKASKTPEPEPGLAPLTPEPTAGLPSGAKQKSRDRLDPFNLPAVPSDLQDHPGLPDTSQEDADFAAFIESRMAALKVSTPPGRALSSAPSDGVDALGLPIVPTFAPADRPAPGLVRRVGYTDEDQKTWCIVCLEDGAIRCLGCGGDVFCARCWKEMHVGPRAGYDERGHRWEKFVRGR